MALYQNTSVNSDALVIGNWKIQVASYNSAFASIASVASAVDNLGAGMVSAFKHEITPINVQSGNAPDPLEGIADETFTVTGELIEIDVAKMATAWSGICTTATTITTTMSIMAAGGKTTIPPRTVLLTNRRIVGSASVETNIWVYKAYMVNGPSFTAKSDNDEDPITVYSFELRGELDASRTAGDQLYSIHKWLD